MPFGFWLGFTSVCLWLGQGADLIRTKAQQPIHTTAAAFAQQTIENPFFYLIEKNGVHSYLLGTHHVGIRGQQLPKFVFQALESSNVFMGEDLDNDGIGPNLSKVKKFEMKALKPKTIEAFRERGIDLKKFNSTTSVIAPCVLYVTREALPEFHQLDKELERKARREHKRLLALDTSAQLTKAVTSVSQECELNAMVEELSPEVAKQNYLRSLQFYIGGLEANMRASLGANEKMLITERNETWLPKIKGAHSQGAFIAVGALHLFGKMGLIESLKRDGYTVTRLRSESQTPFVSQRYTGL